MAVEKITEIVFRVLEIFLGKNKHFSIYITIKIEMNLCSGKTAKLKDLFPIERDCGLMPSYNLNILTSFKA